jgi:predicted glycoside hydrolase/deacetylase ChbG (UPF0249 family)
MTSSALARRVVFVADDLGVAPGIDAGIVAAAAAGNVREASLCVTGASVASGVQLAHEHGIGIGRHLSWTLGQALSGPIRGLTDRTGRFRSLPWVLLACMARNVDGDAVAREIDAQLGRLVELGVTPTHLNGHHHVHVLPVVRDHVFAAAREFGVRWTRLPDERRTVWPFGTPTRWLLSRLARGARAAAVANGMRWLPFVGVSTEACRRFAARAQFIAGALADGDYEWMVHPRRLDDTLRQLDPVGYRRPSVEELQALTDPDLAARLGITPVGYADLADPTT